jgi:hypothetical protein
VVGAPCCRPEGHGSETRLCESGFSIYPTLPAALGPGVFSASNRIEYRNRQIMFLVVKRGRCMCRRSKFVSRINSIDLRITPQIKQTDYSIGLYKYIYINKAIMGPSTQQYFFSSSDVIATTCFDHTIIFRRQTVVYCRKRFA